MRLDARQRQGFSIAALIYLVGYIVGRAAGKEQAAQTILNHGASHSSP